MTTPITLDVHAHLAPVCPERLAAIPGVTFDANTRTMTLDGHVVSMKPLFDAEALIAWMDRQAIAQAWISVPPPLYRQHLRGQEALAWSDYLNDGLTAIAAAHASRLDPLLHLPTENPDIAAVIASQSVARGHRRFAMPAGTGDDRVLSDAVFDPLWAVLDAAEAFVFFHPGECGDGRLRSFYLANLVGNPYESTVAVTHMVFGGVLERYTGITPCFAHGGGLTPMVAGRLTRGYETYRPGIDRARAAPREMLRRIYVDCICHDPAALALAEDVFGPEKVVFGSDWPFPMGMLDPGVQLAGTREETLRRLTVDNPETLRARFSGPAV